MNSKYLLLNALQDLFIAATYHPNSYIRIADDACLYSRMAIELLHAKQHKSVPTSVLTNKFDYAIIRDSHPTALPIDHDNILDLRFVASLVMYDPVLCHIEKITPDVTVQSLFDYSTIVEIDGVGSLGEANIGELFGALPGTGEEHETNKKLH